EIVGSSDPDNGGGTPGAGGSSGTDEGSGGSGGGTGWSNLNRNRQQVADAIRAYFTANGGIPAVFAALTPSQLTEVSGETGTAAAQAGLLAADRFLDAIGE